MRHGAKNFPNILTHFYGTPWAILPEKLEEMHRVLWSRINDPNHFVHAEQFRRTRPGESLGRNFPSFQSPEAALSGTDVTNEEGKTRYQLVGSVAIININGVINSRASMFDEYSGGTGHDDIGAATDQAVNDPKVESIVYNIDSPGGTMFGQPENAAKVFAARKVKPTTAVANHVAASAAYWYMSQASAAVVTPAGEVGCVGVLMRSIDETKLNEMVGIKDILISNESSPYKTEGYPQVPFTEQQRAYMQQICNDCAKTFAEAIAKGRGIRPATVEKSFGQGRMLMAESALEANMVDRIGTLEEVVNQANQTRTRQTRAKVAAQLVSMGLPTRKGGTVS